MAIRRAGSLKAAVKRLKESQEKTATEAARLRKEREERIQARRERLARLGLPRRSGSDGSAV